MNDDRPTKEQIAEAREWLLMKEQDQFSHDAGPATWARIRVLLAATETSPVDERPADMAELAKLVAKELRRRGIWAVPLFGDDPHIVYVPRPQRSKFVQHDFRFPDLFWFVHSLYASQCNNLTPSEIADVIQAEEAKKAAEWAGDE